jgi:hypothetical protein
MTDASWPPGDPLDAGLRIATSFEKHAVSYALGGALAYGLWGVPRATVDVDVNVFVEPDGLDRVIAALQGAGVAVTLADAVTAAAREGRFTGRFGPYRVDVFTPSIEFSWEAQRTRVRRVVEGVEAWFLSAESLAVFKLLFFRAKDLVDLERLVAVQGTRLDVGWVRARIVDMMGEGDARVRRWDELSSGRRA